MLCSMPKIKIKLTIHLNVFPGGASGKEIGYLPITSWQIDGETVETVADFIFLCSKITADGDCSHEMKRHLVLGRKAMTNLDSVFKSGDLTFPTPQLKTINSLVLSLLYGPLLTSIHDYWKNHGLNSTDLCWQSDFSAS